MAGEEECQSPPLWAKGSRRDFKWHTHGVKIFYEKSRIQFTMLVFAVRLYIWKQLDCHQNLSSAQMLESPTMGPAVMHRQKLKLIYSFPDNCNQLASCQ